MLIELIQSGRTTSVTFDQGLEFTMSKQQVPARKAKNQSHPSRKTDQRMATRMWKNAAYKIIRGNGNNVAIPEPDLEANSGETPVHEEKENKRKGKKFRRNKVQEVSMRIVNANRFAFPWNDDNNQSEKGEGKEGEDAEDNENNEAAPKKRQLTEMHSCARQGDVEGINEILTLPELNINLRDKKEMTPLHLAAQNGYEEIVKKLLSEGADRYLKDKDEALPLHYAASNGFIKCVDVLIKGCLRNGHYLSTQSERPACKDCNVNSPSFDIDEPDGKGNTALYYAVVGGYQDIVNLLLGNDANPTFQNKQEITPLHEAAGLKSTYFLDILFNISQPDIFQVDERGRNIIHFAVTENSAKCLKYLLEKNFVREKINRWEGAVGTPLLYAISCRNLRCVDILLKNGASPSLDCNDVYPIHRAAETGFHLACERLLAKDSSVITERDKNGQTPLHMAAVSCHIETVDLICKEITYQQLSPSDEDDSGQTALHVAVKKANEKVVRRLISSSISVGKQDSRGFTALHLAASLGKTRCCEILVESASTNLHKFDKNGFFPLDLAFQNIDKAQDTISYLLKESFTESKHMLPKQKNPKFLVNLMLLKFRMRKYMEKALDKNYRDIVNAIIESSLWLDAFSGGKKLQPENFKTLIDVYPDLAFKVLGKHIKSKSGDQSTFEFTVLEDNYYMEEESSPFDEETGRLKKNALEHRQDVYSWAENHPVNHMIRNNEVELLKHPVTQSWLKNKWHSYIFLIHSKLLLLQGVYLAALVCLMATSWNWVHIGNAFNITKEEFCETARTFPYKSRTNITSLQTTNQSSVIKAFEKAVDPYIGFYYWVFITWIFKVISEIFYISRLRLVYWRTDNLPHFVIEITQLIMTMVLLFVPFGMCYNRRLGLLQEDLAWQCGIFAVLFAWLHLISSVNQALTSEFLPITKDFLEILVKVAYFLVTFIIIFAFIFHLLLFEQKAYSSVLQAIGSTLVWMLLDLGYTDTFVEQPLTYPILSNFIFFLFITTIGCLLLSLISKERTKKSKGKELDNDYRRLAIYAQSMFRYDICFPSLRRKFAVVKYVYNDKNKNLLESYLGTIENKELSDVKYDNKDIAERLHSLESLLLDVSDQITYLRLQMSEKTVKS